MFKKEMDWYSRKRKSFHIIEIFAIFYLGVQYVKSLEYIDVFKADSQGYLSRQVTVWGGSLSNSSCVLYCGCQGYSYAYVKTDQCWCGNDITVCSSTCSQDVLEKYNAQGYSSSFANSIPSKIDMYSTLLLTANILPNTVSNSFVINKRVTYTSTNSGSFLFPYPGNFTIFTETNGPECPSTEQSIIVKAAPLLLVSAPSQMPYNATSIYVDVYVGGTDISSLIIEVLFNATVADTKSFSPASGSIYLPVGGVMETDRFRDYGTDPVGPYLSINMDHEVLEDGKVLSFEAHVTVLGELTFVVLELFCIDSSLKVDYTQKLCASNGTQNPYFYFGSSNSIFYPASMGFTTNLDTVTNILTDLRVVFVYPVTATMYGNQVFQIPKSINFIASAGQILGWLSPNSGSGVLGRYDRVSSANNPTIYIKSINKVKVGDVINKAIVTSVVVENFEHMIKMHVEVKGKYKILIAQNIYSTGGDLVTRAKLISNERSQLLVSNVTLIVLPITGFNASSKRFVLKDEVFKVFFTFATGGKGAKICINWGEAYNQTLTSCDEITDLNETNHSFDNGGLYTINFLAYSQYFSQNTSLDVIVYCDSEVTLLNINGSTVTDVFLPLSTVMYLQPIFIYVYLSGCGFGYINYTITGLQFNLPDVIVKGSVPVFLGNASLFTVEIDGFSVYTNITAEVLFDNLVQTKKSVHFLESIVPISCLPISDVYLETMKSTEVLIITEGTQDNCTIDWGNLTTTVYKRNSFSDVTPFLVTISYSLSKTYYVTIFCQNKLSQCNNSFQAHIQDPPDVSIISPAVLPFSESRALFWISLGTNLTIKTIWYLAGGEIMETQSAVGINPNVSRNLKLPYEFKKVMGVSSLYNLSTGVHRVCLNVTNNIDQAFYCANHTVQEKVKAPLLQIINSYNIVTSYFEENENFTIKILSYEVGQNVSYMFNFSDGTIMNTTDSFVTYSYLKWKMCYNLQVTAWNLVSAVSNSTNVCVYEPIIKILNGTIIANSPENSTEKMKINFKFLNGSFFNCSVNYNDGSAVNVFSSDTVVGGVVDISHQYETPGTYNLTMFCVSRLYTDIYFVELVSENYVIKPILDIKSRCINGSNVVDKPPIDGIGSDKIFSSGCNFWICMLDQTGTNVMVNVSMSVDGVYVGSELKEGDKSTGICLEYKFPNLSGSEKYQLTFDILSKNSVSQNQVQFNASILEMVMPFNVTLTNSEKPSLNVPAKIKIVYSNTPGDACVSINFGDNSNKVKVGSNLLVYGNQFCQNLDEYLYHSYHKGQPVAGGTLELSYQYIFANLYQIIVDVKNKISQYTVILPVKVEDYPCFPPDISFLTPFGSTPQKALEVAQFPKCENVTFKFQAIPNCLRPNTTISKSITISLIDNNTMSVLSQMLETNESRYTVYGNLDYGWYQLDYKATMKDLFDQHVIPETQSSISGFFLIKGCPLRIKINEGNGLTAKQGGMIYLNALNSSDPDNTKATLKAQWFCAPCKVMNQTMNYDTIDRLIYPISKVDPNTSNFVGCFGKEPIIGKLSDKGHNGLVLELDTSFMKVGCYELRLLVYIQGDISGRTKTEQFELVLTDSEPLKLQIKCVLNCLEKINPNTKLTFESVLLNKNQCHSILVNQSEIATQFNWTILQKLYGTNNLYEDVTESFINKSYTGFHQQNLVLLANVLSYNFSYKFKFSAVCEGLSVGTTEINKDVNSPPNIVTAKCSLSPQMGFAMDTDFEMNCFYAQDSDLPLVYSYLYRCGDNDAVWEDWTLGSSVYPPVVSKLKLPCNTSSSSKDCQIKVIVRDSYGMTSEPIFGPSMVANVKCPSNIHRREVSEEVPMCNTINSTAVQMDQGVLSNYMAVLNKMLPFLNPKAKDFCEKRVRDSVLNIAVDSPDSAFMLLSSIGTPSTTSSNNTIQPSADQKAVEKAKIEFADKMLNVMMDTLNVLDKFTPEQLTTFANKVFATTTMLTGTLTGAMAAANVKKAMEIEAKVAGLGAAKMSIGEPPQLISTANGKIIMRCIDSTKPADFDGFSFYSIEKKSSESCLGSVNSIGDNRYGFDKSSADNIKGSVLGLSLSDKSGQRKTIANLTQPIYIVLNNTEPLPPLKNFTAYCQLMRNIHRIDANVNSSIIVAYIQPMFKNFTGNFFIFANKGTAPSLVDHQLNCTLPNPDPDNWDNMTAEEQWYWNVEKKWTCFWDQTDLNGTAIGIWCAGVVFYYNNSLTTKLLPLSASPSEDNCTTPIQYYFQAYTRSCLFWSNEKGTWDGDGCTIIENDTNINQTKCACNHLTDFGGGGPFATREPINLSSTLANINIASNPTVFSVMISLIGLYIILLVWARKKDNQDKIKSQVNLLPCNHPTDTYFYEIKVQTGFQRGSSTTADVSLVIYGEEGESAPRRLCSNTKQCFQNGETDIFLVSVPESLGEIKEIEIWHNNAGPSPGWYCVQISIRDLQTQTAIDFICNSWLDLIEGDGLIFRKLRPAEKEEKENFSFLFSINLIQNLYDGHIWLSLFTKPTLSTFTRCQRLATCTSFLLTAMMTNCMFYRGDTGKPSESITIWFLTFSIDQLKVAFTSIVIVTPVNLLVITLFKQASPHPNNSEEYEISNSPTKKISLRLKVTKFFQSILILGKEDSHEARIRIKNKALPHWLIYIGYFLAFTVSVTCSFFIVMYSFSFGKVKAEKWMVSMVFAFLQSVFIIEPVKVVLLSIFFSLLLKSSPKMQPIVIDPLNKSKNIGANYKAVVDQFDNEYKVPDSRKLDEAKKTRLKEKEIKIIIKEALIHTSLVALCLIVAYSALDPSAYQLFKSVNQLCTKNGIRKEYFSTKSLDNSTDFPTAEGIATVSDWWDWIMYSVVEYLFPDGWYNKMKYEEGFVADSAASKVLSMARIRQLRVKPMSCTKHPVFEYLIEQCNAAYSWYVEETFDFKAGWLPPLNHTERLRRRRGKRKAIWKGFEDPWLYQSSSILNNPFPFTGKFAVYNGASYSVSIGPAKRFAKRILNNMKKNFWVDRYTRALFTEINIYNANTNMMLIVIYLHEILPTGGWNFYSNIQSLRLYRYIGGMGQLNILFDIIFSFVTLVGCYKMFKAIRRNGFKTYIFNVWNLLHVVVTVSSMAAIVLQIGRMLAVKAAVALYTEDPEVFVSFQYVGSMEYLIAGSMGIALFFVNLEFLRILRFNYQISMLTKTIGILGVPLGSFAIIFIVIFMAYVSFAYCLYVDKLEEFDSILSSFVTLTTMFLGKFDVHAYFNNAPFFGPLMFASYMLLIQMVMINLFVGVICDGFVEIGKQEEEEEPADILEFISTRVKTIATGAEVIQNPIYSEWLDDWDSMILGVSELCDNCIYIMRNIEGEDTRQVKFFETADEKKINLLKAVLGLDFYVYENEFCDSIAVLERKLKEISLEDANILVLKAALIKIS